jgi:FKBP-type peptidyl-prolyl cis-trans isomerase
MSTAEELKIEVLRPPSDPEGTKAASGHTLLVHYVGTLTDGTKFDSSRDRKDFFTFKLGDGMVIKGWDLGLVGMQDGEVRKLTVPGDLGYGAKGVPGLIPPDATLIFEIELLEIWE